MIYSIVVAKSFKKAFRRIRKSDYFDLDKFEFVIDRLGKREELPSQYRDHDLQGDFANCRECHIKNDLLLIYEVDDNLGQITLVDIGSHSQLFG